jgi:hypothetical protein
VCSILLDHLLDRGEVGVAQAGGGSGVRTDGGRNPRAVADSNPRLP